MNMPCLIFQFFLVLFGRCLVVGQMFREPLQFPNLSTVAELAARGGYKVTNYEVITEDGYNLWLFRLGDNDGPPVLVQHGLVVAPDSWIIRGNNKDLPFTLMELGYDVWLPSLRGTVFNEYSFKYNKTDPRFWDFSFHQYGYYDEPAFIDTILHVRKKRQLYYIGHSIGTSAFLVMCSSRPEYNLKIRAAILLSPIAFSVPIPERTPAFRVTLDSAESLINVLRRRGIYDPLPRTKENIEFSRSFCTNSNLTRTMCLDIVGIFSGENRVNLVDFDSFIPYYGAGAPLNAINHIVQVYQTGEFKQYDLGPIENMKRYGTTRPPEYNLKLVSAPVAMFWGANDVLLSRTSINRLVSELPNLIIEKAVSDPKFTHIDMYIGDNADRVLYPDIVDTLGEFSNEKRVDSSRIDPRSYGSSENVEERKLRSSGEDSSYGEGEVLLYKRILHKEEPE